MSAATVKRIEFASAIRGTAESLWKLQTALEKAGVEFIPADDQKGPGVRCRETNRRGRRATAAEQSRSQATFSKRTRKQRSSGSVG